MHYSVVSLSTWSLFVAALRQVARAELAKAEARLVKIEDAVIADPKGHALLESLTLQQEKVRALRTVVSGYGQFVPVSVVISLVSTLMLCLLWIMLLFPKWDVKYPKIRFHWTLK